MYAPAKGILHGGKILLQGLVAGTAALVVGTGSLVVNAASGVKEMGHAGVFAVSKRRNSEPVDPEVPQPNFMRGLKRATVGSVRGPLEVFIAVYCCNVGKCW